MPRAKKAASKSKKNNKRKAPEPPAGAAPIDGAGPSSAPATTQAPNSSAEGAIQPPVQGQSQQENTLETRRKAALTMLLNLGLPEPRVLRALDATAEEHSAEAETWAEEAGVWLAVDNECADEAGVMGAAMQMSLVEAEERKATEKPLVDQTGNEIIEKFKDSELLDVLRHALARQNKETGTDPSSSGNPEKAAAEEEKEEDDVEKEKPDAASDFINEISTENNDSAIKKVLVEYLLMEQRCKKWYACSKPYFAKFSECLKTSIEEIKKKRGGSNFSTAGGVAKETQTTEAGEAGAETAHKEQDEQDASAAIITELIADISTYFMTSLTAELAVLNKAVYALPEDDNAGPPSIFAPYMNVQEEVDLVDA